MPRSKAFRPGAVAKMKSTRLTYDIDGREYRAAGKARVLVVSVKTPGRLGRKIAHTVRQLLADQTARHALKMEVSDVATTAVGTEFDCAWHLTGTESVLSWILDYVTGRIGSAKYLCEAHWGMANHDREVMTPVGETTGEMAEIKLLLATRHKAIVKEEFAACRDGDDVKRGEFLAARREFQETIPDYVEAIRSAPPAVFAAAVAGFSAACQRHGLAAAHYLRG
jgi:hypothetical protein